MNYRGRQIDAIAFWNRYVTFPNVKFDEADVFSPKTACPNPAHDTDKRHFQVNLQEPMVHCFAHCGISGSWEHAICVIEGLYDKFKVEEATDDREHRRRRDRAYREARKVVFRNAASSRISGGSRALAAKRARSGGSAKAVPADELRYESYLPAVALEYLDGRGISSASISQWNLGWHPDDKRIVIPGQDLDGRTRFLIKRGVLPSQHPKYLYTEGFPKTSLLFGACQIDLGMVRSEGLVIVEGSVDTIMFHQHGIRTTGGILGTGISEAQCRIIARIAQAAGRLPRIVLAFDKDTSGIRNIEIAAAMLRKYPLYVMKYPSAKSDPAELTEKEASRQIDRAVPAFRFIQQNNLNVRHRKEISWNR